MFSTPLLVFIFQFNRNAAMTFLNNAVNNKLTQQVVFWISTSFISLCFFFF